MDYAGRQRIKLWGRARFMDDDPKLLARLADPTYPAGPERAILFEITAWDVNCSQHITPRYTEEVIGQVVAKLQARIAELEAEVAALGAEPADLA
jgi:predicted pyridoxine 5'-phosphate oxidase superfamily flavin-nucleotide-binding protein